MSNFKCQKCNTNCIDTDFGYIKGCKHFPPDKHAIERCVGVYKNISYREIHKCSAKTQHIWNVGREVVEDRVPSYVEELAEQVLRESKDT